MSWNYAELSKAAKKAGGPEIYIEGLFQSGKSLGRAEVRPYLGVAGLGGALLGYAIKFIQDKRNSKKKETLVQAEVCKAELIRGIKEYDEKHCSSSDTAQSEATLEKPNLISNIPE